MGRTPAIFAGILFFWAGFVASISFFEAWLKFQAPGVTLPIGLSIGKLVFTVLNRIEWVLLSLLIVLTIRHAKKFPKKFFYISSIIPAALLIQTLWLLPELTRRAEQIIAGNIPGESSAHLIFGVVELLKVATLIYTGYYTVRLYKSSHLKH
ncbi:hypothetical protein [Mariniphaga sediminis]|uniref:hypothetical protein n=1 Tax=Mariniphaga sediminis TaxID=1628158 RepID=UPI00356575A6